MKRWWMKLGCIVLLISLIGTAGCNSTLPVTEPVDPTATAALAEVTETPEVTEAPVEITEQRR